MPRIDDNILLSVIYLYSSVEAAQNGDRCGGSGVLIGVKSPRFPELSYKYAVTNSHVIREGCSPVIRLNRIGGNFEILPLPTEAWVDHPGGDDLAAAFGPNQ